MVDNPAGSPWPDVEHLTVDACAPLGPDSWVAATNGQRCFVGKVESLVRSFTIKDVTTGETNHPVCADID